MLLPRVQYLLSISFFSFCLSPRAIVSCICFSAPVCLPSCVVVVLLFSSLSRSLALTGASSSVSRTVALFRRERRSLPQPPSAYLNGVAAHTRSGVALPSRSRRSSSSSSSGPRAPVCRQTVAARGSCSCVRCAPARARACVCVFVRSPVDGPGGLDEDGSMPRP